MSVNAVAGVLASGTLILGQPPAPIWTGHKTTMTGAAQGPAQTSVVARDEAGRVTLRAIALRDPIRVDGRLDEGVYQTVSPASDFIQQVPKEGAPASERTEAWVLFEGINLYVSARCWDSEPPEH